MSGRPAFDYTKIDTGSFASVASKDIDPDTDLIIYGASTTNRTFTLKLRGTEKTYTVNLAYGAAYVVEGVLHKTATIGSIDSGYTWAVVPAGSLGHSKWTGIASPIGGGALAASFSGAGGNAPQNGVWRVVYHTGTVSVTTISLKIGATTKQLIGYDIPGTIVADSYVVLEIPVIQGTSYQLEDNGTVSGAEVSGVVTPG